MTTQSSLEQRTGLEVGRVRSAPVTTIGQMRFALSIACANTGPNAWELSGGRAQALTSAPTTC